MDGWTLELTFQYFLPNLFIPESKFANPGPETPLLNYKDNLRIDQLAALLLK